MGEEKEHTSGAASSKARRARWGAQVMGALSVLALVALVVVSLWGDEAGPAEALKVHAVSDVAPLGKDRFVYTARLSIEVTPASKTPACLLVLNREGELLGGARPLVREGQRWVLEGSASELSESSYGPLWLVALAAPGGCEEGQRLVAGARGSERPVEQVAQAVAQAPGVRWGSQRIYVHDKLP